MHSLYSRMRSLARKVFLRDVRTFEEVERNLDCAVCFNELPAGEFLASFNRVLHEVCTCPYTCVYTCVYTCLYTCLWHVY